MNWIDALRSAANQWWFLLTLAVLGVIFQFYGHVAGSPDSVLMSEGGDGIKNYYTLLWHSNHDDGFLHYTGSGYPFGEQVFFTDGHPLLSWVLQVLPFLAPYAVGILNSILLFGLVLCAWCLFAVLRQLELPAWAAAVGAFGITMLQPQIFRMGGHLSLAHSWMIPLLFLLVLRAQASERWLKWSIITGFALLSFFLTHPYIGLMGVLFVLGYHAFSLPFRDRWRNWRSYVAPALAAITPMIVFLLLLGWGDPTADRPISPHGADKYSSSVMSLIVPTHDPFVTPLREFIRYDAIDWETWCYLGLSSLLLLIVAGGVQLKRWVGRTDRTPLDRTGALLGAGFLVLLFAMSVWQALLGESLPMLAQFRGAGRFAWVFYFACGVFCTARLYQWLFVDGARKPVAAAVFLIVIGFYAVEGWDYHVRSGLTTGRTANVFRYDELRDDQRIMVEVARKSGAASIIPLPYLHVGSELYQKDAPEGVMAAALPIAFHSGVPLMAGITSRASLQHTRDLLAILAPTAYPKALKFDVPKVAVFILYRNGAPLESAEADLWARATPLFDGEPASLRLISASELFRDDHEARKAQYASTNGAMQRVGEWALSSNGPADPSHFRSVRTAAETSSINSTVNDYTTVMEFRAGELDSAVTYEVSLVYKAIDPASVNCSFILETTSPKHGNTNWDILRNVRAMPIQVPGTTIVSLSFKPTDPERSIKFMLKGPDKLGARYTVDHILLRPIGVDAWREGTWMGAPTVFLNNVPLSPAGRATTP